METKSILRFYPTPVIKAAIKKTNKSKCWGGCKKWKTLIDFSERVIGYSHYGNQCRGFPKIIIDTLWYWALWLLGIVLKVSLYYYRDICSFLTYWQQQGSRLNLVAHHLMIDNEKALHNGKLFCHEEIWNYALSRKWTELGSR